jgi:hypothetical protein
MGWVRCSGEPLGEGFGERFSQCMRGGVGGVGGDDGGDRCNSNCESDEDRRQSSGFVAASVSGGGIERRSGGSGDSSFCSCWRAAAGSSGPVSCGACDPMTSVMMRARSTLCDGDVSGSMSCEAAEGGGQTPSRNMEPDSDARTRRRRGGE